jgi:hypothetical protein
MKKIVKGRPDINHILSLGFFTQGPQVGHGEACDLLSHMSKKVKEFESGFYKQSLEGGEQYYRGAGDEEDEKTYDDDESMELMNKLGVHDSKESMVASAVLNISKHPLALEEHFQNLASEDVFKFEKTGDFSYQFEISADPVEQAQKRTVLDEDFIDYTPPEEEEDKNEYGEEAVEGGDFPEKEDLQAEAEEEMTKVYATVKKVGAEDEEDVPLYCLVLEKDADSDGEKFRNAHFRLL